MIGGGSLREGQGGDGGMWRRVQEITGNRAGVRGSPT